MMFPSRSSCQARGRCPSRRPMMTLKSVDRRGKSHRSGYGLARGNGQEPISSGFTAQHSPVKQISNLRNRSQRVDNAAPHLRLPPSYNLLVFRGPRSPRRLRLGSPRTVLFTALVCVCYARGVRTQRVLPSQQVRCVVSNTVRSDLIPSRARSSVTTSYPSVLVSHTLVRQRHMARIEHRSRVPSFIPSLPRSLVTPSPARLVITGSCRRRQSPPGARQQGMSRVPSINRAAWLRCCYRDSQPKRSLHQTL